MSFKKDQIQVVDSKLISQKDTTVEVIDFRKDHIRDLFSNSLPDQALQKLITETFLQHTLSYIMIQ